MVFMQSLVVSRRRVRIRQAFSLLLTLLLRGLIRLIIGPSHPRTALLTGTETIERCFEHHRTLRSAINTKNPPRTRLLWTL